jgi:hypothetical protein
MSALRRIENENGDGLENLFQQLPVHELGNTDKDLCSDVERLCDELASLMDVPRCRYFAL